MDTTVAQTQVTSRRVVYIPGMSLAGGEFDDCAELLIDGGVDYRCVQRPGLGQMPDPNWQQPLDVRVEQERVRAALAPACIVVAHSFGGYLVPEDARIAAIIYLDASLPNEPPLPLGTALWRLLRPVARVLAPVLRRAIITLYENASFVAAREYAQRQTHRCRIIVLTAGGGGSRWFRKQRHWAESIGAEHRWVDGPHLVAWKRPRAIAAQILTLAQDLAE